MEDGCGSRAIPIVSLIARPRFLAQLVSTRAHLAALERTFEHSRFVNIVLADSNLPAIVARRVIKPRDETAKEALRGASAEAWRGAHRAWETLLGSLGDESAFHLVYPFSPALIDSLVTLSCCLQRKRTPIQILVELLVEYLPQLELGAIVPVGDVFDLIAGSEEPFDQGMHRHFDRVRHLYLESFLPVIRAEHGTEVAEKCQRLREDFPKRLGCSGCTQLACRNDNRLAKTLLMEALLPGPGTFGGLTVKKLVHLNHGTVNSPIPGADVHMAAEKLRRWKDHVEPLHVGTQLDPEIILHMPGLDEESTDGER